MERPWKVVAITAVGLAACTSLVDFPEVPPQRDASVTPDAATGPTRDASRDAAHDAGEPHDAGRDATLDGSPDAVSDARIDALADAKAEAARDATADARADVGPDAAPAESGGAVDGSHDAGDARPDHEAGSTDAAAPVLWAQRCIEAGVETFSPDAGWGHPYPCASGTCADGGGSCAGLTASATSCADGGPGLGNCGPDAGESCCTSLDIPGGTYDRVYQGEPDGGFAVADGGPAPASVSGLRIDKYEVTVGRFRNFVAAWTAGYRPPAGSGRHSHLNAGAGLNGVGGGYEIGWLTGDDSNVAPSTANLQGCAEAFPVGPSLPTSPSTWVASPSADGSSELRPINCVSFYEAYAFCIWDAGFLPSEAEWEFAAAAGGAQREYPWGAADPGTLSAYANYGCYFDETVPQTCSYTVDDIAAVGSFPAGAGRWGHQDLAGNLGEFVLDAFMSPYGAPRCINCSQALGAPSSSGFLPRSVRGGDFTSVASQIVPSARGSYSGVDRSSVVGIRCARTP